MPAIRICDLHYSYPPLVAEGLPVSVLKGVNLEIESGEFVSILGPTGVGKTTLCLALNGIVPHSAGGVFKGDVWVLDNNTKQTDVATLASMVGIVFQDPESQFFNMTVEDEVAFGPESLGLEPRIIEERVEWALEVVGMSQYRRRSPFQLSGGQKQRVAIASIMAMQPKVLVLDEPTSGLDPVGKAEVFRVVRELKQQRGMTIIMVEQEAEKIADFSDRVVILENGAVALQGTPREVFSQTEFMERIGLSIPQVSELALLFNYRLKTNYNFIYLDETYNTLAADLGPAVQGK
ncbi:MAG: ATP-binding cassette domain-containing protein [Anaerolineales bacterium]|nr:ATP-binding cassette domain-containing protein [Anaerolineales bacterium]